MNTEILTPGDKLKELRKKYGIKQHEISKNDISRNMISMIETNKANLIESTAKILIDNMKELCEKKSIEFDISLEYLLESAESQVEKIAKELISVIDITPEKILGKEFELDLAKVLSILDKYNLKSYKATIYEKLGEFYISKYDYYKAYTYYLMAFQNFNNLFNNIELIGLIIDISFCCGKLNRHKEKLEFSNLARIYMPNMPLKYRYKLEYNDALALKNLKNYNAAIEKILYIEESFSSILSSNTTRTLNLMILKANCYTEIKSYKVALEIHLKILKQSQKNIETYLITLINIINIYNSLNDSKNIKKYLDQCLFVLKDYSKLENKIHSPEIYSDMGYAFYFLKEYEQSKFYLNLAISEGKRYKNISVIEKSIDKLLKIYVLQNDEEYIDSLKTELLELVSIKILPHNNDLVFKFINYYSSIKDNDAVADITSFVISQSPSE